MRIDLALLGCSIIGALISLFDGIAGGAILAATLFLAAGRLKLSAQLAAGIVCAAIALLCVTATTQSLSAFNAPLTAVAAAGALHLAFAAISNFGSEGTE